MLREVHKLAIPELTRVFGNCGLYLRASAAVAPELSGNMLAQVISLHRDGAGFAGQARCADGEMPFASSSLALVYASFVLESSLAPQSLLNEAWRMLKPEGVAMVFGLNPWSPGVVRRVWPRSRLLGAGMAETMARRAGFEIVSRHFLGRHFQGGRDAIGNSWRDRWRSAYLLVLRRRESTMTPLRNAASAASLRPGVSLG
jgi:SAM-dependent methyltransferase